MAYDNCPQLPHFVIRYIQFNLFNQFIIMTDNVSMVPSSQEPTPFYGVTLLLSQSARMISIVVLSLLSILGLVIAAVTKNIKGWVKVVIISLSVFSAIVAYYFYRYVARFMAPRG